MIKADQPTCFPDDVAVVVSSKNDNTMLDRSRSFHDAPAIRDRAQFCEQVSLRYDHCVFQLIQYDDNQTYCHVVEVNESDVTAEREEVAGDGLFTTIQGVGLFLPVADCVATVVYDPVLRYIALLHLGRHATYADLSTCAVTHFTEKGSRPNDLVVWMSPSAKRETYWVDNFDFENDPKWQNYYEKNDGKYYLDLPGYNQQRFIENGVQPANIHISGINTMTNPDYFSHRGGDAKGRIAVVAMIR